MKPIQILFMIAPLTLLSLIACNEKSLCDNVMCENDGICLDGTCDCPTGYTGVHCQERANPDYIIIRTLTVTRFPGSKESNTWDELDGPDIFFRLLDEKTPIAQPDELVENANASQSYQFKFHFIEITHPDHTFRLQLLDYDGTDTKEDFMGEISFVPLEKMKDFPVSLTLDDGGPVAFTMTLDYYYNNND